MYRWTFIILSIFSTGCAEKQPLSKSDIECEKHVVVYDSFTAELFEVNEQEKLLHSLKRINPRNDVIGQAIFNCQNGVFLLNTEERMKSGVDSILHAVFQNGEEKINFKYGINSIIPYGKDEYLIREQIIRGNKYDIARTGSYSGASDAFAPESLLQNETYIDDAIVNLKKFEVVRKIKGTFDPHEYQGGKYITFSNDKVVLDFSPKDGSRELISDYRRGRKEGGNSVNITQMGAQYFYLGNRLYLANGESSEDLLRSGGRFLPKNTVFYFDDILKNWVNILELGDRPLLIIHNDEKLIIVCQQVAFEINYHTNESRKFEISLNNYSWRSIAELKSHYLIFGFNSSNIASVFLASKDFKKFEPVSIGSEFSHPKISTMLTPISPKNILQ